MTLTNRKRTLNKALKMRRKPTILAQSPLRAAKSPIPLELDGVKTFQVVETQLSHTMIRNPANAPGEHSSKILTEVN